MLRILAVSYEQTIASIDASIHRAADDIDSSVDLAAQSMDLLLAESNGKLTRSERSLIHNVEILFASAMHREAWLLHRRGEHDDARRALAAARRFQEATDRILV